MNRRLSVTVLCRCTDLWWCEPGTADVRLWTPEQNFNRLLSRARLLLQGHYFVDRVVCIICMYTVSWHNSTRLRLVVKVHETNKIHLTHKETEVVLILLPFQLLPQALFCWDEISSVLSYSHGFNL